jgi:hypothetical protein
MDMDIIMPLLPNFPEPVLYFGYQITTKKSGETHRNTCTQAVARHKSTKLLALAMLVRNVGMRHAMLLKWEWDREECSASVVGFLKTKEKRNVHFCNAAEASS